MQLFAKVQYLSHDLISTENKKITCHCSCRYSSFTMLKIKTCMMNDYDAQKLIIQCENLEKYCNFITRHMHLKSPFFNRNFSIYALAQT